MCLFGVHLEMDQWFNQFLLFIYLICIHYVFIMIFSDKKSDTMWYINYCVDLEYIWLFNSDLMFQILIFIYCIINNWSSICYNWTGWVALAYFSLPGPKSYFYILRLFIKLHLSTIRNYVFIYWYWMTFDQTWQDFSSLFHEITF